MAQTNLIRACGAPWGSLGFQWVRAKLASILYGIVRWRKYDNYSNFWCTSLGGWSGSNRASSSSRPSEILGLDSHWVFLDSTCRSRWVQAAICPRILKASKVCNCIQKQAVGPSIFRWAKVVCFRWAKVFVWWDLFTFCRMLLWKWRFWKCKIMIGDPWASQNQVARNWFASAHRQHACMHLNIFARRSLSCAMRRSHFVWEYFKTFAGSILN